MLYIIKLPTSLKNVESYTQSWNYLIIIHVLDRGKHLDFQKTSVQCPFMASEESNLPGVGRERRKNTETENMEAGGLGSLLEGPLHSRTSACLLFRVEQGKGGVITYN